MDKATFSLDEVHLQFAKSFNGITWGLLDKASLTLEEIETMIHAAHSSLFHWQHVGKTIHQQRGEYMLGHVYTAAGIADRALHHAQRCLLITETHPDEMEDFDIAFAYECLARAHACAGNLAEARKIIEQADKAGQVIKDREDKQIWQMEFTRGEWYGARVE